MRHRSSLQTERKGKVCRFGSVRRATMVQVQVLMFIRDNSYWSAVKRRLTISTKTYTDALRAVKVRKTIALKLIDFVAKSHRLRRLTHRLRRWSRATHRARGRVGCTGAPHLGRRRHPPCCPLPFFGRRLVARGAPGRYIQYYNCTPGKKTCGFNFSATNCVPSTELGKKAHNYFAKTSSAAGAAVKERKTV